MGHKRVVFIISWIIGISLLIGTLFISCFQLYKEAEKAQKTAFTGIALKAGHDIATQIDQLINDELCSDSTYNPSNYASNQIKELFMENGKPKAIITQYIDEYHGEIFVIRRDTLPISPQIDTGIDTQLVVYDTITNDYSLLIDSAINSLQPAAINNLILNTLKKYQLSIDFEYGIFNAAAGSFVRANAPTTDDFFKKGYVFALHSGDSKAHTHYFILHFPSERSYFFKKMMWIVLPIIGIILLLSILLLIFIITFNQQKRNHEITNAFINNMTHEFKTPISTISLACEALTDQSIQNDSETVNSFVSMIQDENWRLQKMVTNILDLARLKRGQLNLRQEDVNIHAMLNRILRNFALQVSNRNGEIITCYNAENAVVCGDPSHLESIFVNLIENALKYCEKAPCIRITTSLEKEGIRIDIQDNGVGISKKNLRHIFDEFYRVTKGNIHDTQGYGLGLNFVKKITQLHKGEISVRSEVGKGTVFTIHLPVKTTKS